MATATKKKKSTVKKNLVIVESPAKAKTIEKYLGRNYKVLASVGHIRDLKKSSMSVDIENNYEPQYINIRGKGPLINDLKKEAKKANKRLQDYIGNDHLVLSEYGPGEQPLKFHFPARNRIIAGLCRGVIVAEAKLRSGSLITCERAMEEGRDVFAIPGSILDGLSDGCHHLIQEGAKLVTSGQDVLAEFEF